MVTPEIIQVFKDILTDLPAVEIHKLASKIRYGIAIYGNPIDIQINTVFIAYFKYLLDKCVQLDFQPTNLNYLCPVSWLSVYHLTCAVRRIGRQDRSDNVIALNSRHVELQPLSSCVHILWQTCSP